MKLSILIPTIPERESMLSRLLWCIENQLNDEVEILIYKDNGEIPYGQKVSKMISISKGEYIVIIDDDDLIADDYIETILKNIELNPDFIGYNLLYTNNGKFQFIIEHNYNNKSWYGQNLEHRGFSPKCVIKKDIFSKFIFGDNYNSDQIISKEIDNSDLIKNSIFINRCMYFYDYWSDYALGASNKDNSFINHVHIQRDVGIYPFNKEKFIWI